MNHEEIIAKATAGGEGRSKEGSPARTTTTTNNDARHHQDLLGDFFNCPISLERMRDPVMLVQSGITYDREHLCRSLLHFPAKDPKSNVTYDVPLEYSPNFALRALLTQLHGDKAFEEFDDGSFKTEYNEAWDKAMLEKLETSDDDKPLAFETVRILADRGHAKAQFELGLAYEEGEKEYEGVAKDYDAAKMWLRKAAEQRHAAAQFELGWLYRNGKKGVEPPNHNLAVRWCRKAAEQNYAKAQYNLGCCYDKGRGVKQSYNMAVEWWRKAANQNLASAQYNLGCSYSKNEGVEQSDELAVYWWRKAANQSHADAQNNLGVAYEKGVGVVEKNLDLASEWYEKAANQGHTGAKTSLEALLSRSETP